MQNTLSQGYAFLAYLYAGAALSIVYDVCGMLGALFDNRVVSHLLDAVFVLAFALAAYTAIALADDGAIRLYGFITMASGAVLMHWAFGSAICKRIVKRRR